MNDQEFRRRAHALLAFVIVNGPDKWRDELGALRDAGPEAAPVTFATIPRVVDPLFVPPPAVTVEPLCDGCFQGPPRPPFAHCACCGGNAVEHVGPCCRVGF